MSAETKRPEFTTYAEIVHEDIRVTIPFAVEMLDDPHGFGAYIGSMAAKVLKDATERRERGES